MTENDVKALNQIINSYILSLRKDLMSVAKEESEIITHNMLKRNMWSTILMRLSNFISQSSNIVDPRINFLPISKDKEDELIQKLIDKFESLEEYEYCAFILKHQTSIH